MHLRVTKNDGSHGMYLKHENTMYGHFNLHLHRPITASLLLVFSLSQFP